MIPRLARARKLSMLRRREPRRATRYRARLAYLSHIAGLKIQGLDLERR
jgi:hypothetical protein